MKIGNWEISADAQRLLFHFDNDLKYAMWSDGRSWSELQGYLSHSGPSKIGKPWARITSSTFSSFSSKITSTVKASGARGGVSSGIAVWCPTHRAESKTFLTPNIKVTLSGGRYSASATLDERWKDVVTAWPHQEDTAQKNRTHEWKLDTQGISAKAMQWNHLALSLGVDGRGKREGNLHFMVDGGTKWLAKNRRKPLPGCKDNMSNLSSGSVHHSLSMKECELRCSAAKQCKAFQLECPSSCNIATPLTTRGTCTLLQCVDTLSFSEKKGDSIVVEKQDAFEVKSTIKPSTQTKWSVSSLQGAPSLLSPKSTRNAVDDFFRLLRKTGHQKGGIKSRIGESDNGDLGVIEEVRFWSSQRTKDQITLQKDKIISNVAHKLTSYWPADEDNGNVVYDETVTRNDATITNSNMQRVSSDRMVSTTEVLIKGATASTAARDQSNHVAFDMVRWRVLQVRGYSMERVGIELRPNDGSTFRKQDCEAARIEVYDYVSQTWVQLRSSSGQREGGRPEPACLSDTCEGVCLFEWKRQDRHYLLTSVPQLKEDYNTDYRICSEGQQCKCHGKIYYGRMYQGDGSDGNPVLDIQGVLHRSDTVSKHSHGTGLLCNNTEFDVLKTGMPKRCVCHDFSKMFTGIRRCAKWNSCDDRSGVHVRVMKVDKKPKPMVIGGTSSFASVGLNLELPQRYATLRASHGVAKVDIGNLDIEQKKMWTNIVDNNALTFETWVRRDAEATSWQGALFDMVGDDVDALFSFRFSHPGTANQDGQTLGFCVHGVGCLNEYTPPASGNPKEGRSGGHKLLSFDMLPTDRWFHLALVWDGTSLVVYVDGQLRSIQSFTLQKQKKAVHPWAPVREKPVLLGSHHGILADPACASKAWPNPCRFNGEMDDVRVWSRARTPFEIKALMFDHVHRRTIFEDDSDLQQKERRDTLVASWTFEEGLADINNAAATDASLNGNGVLFEQDLKYGCPGASRPLGRLEKAKKICCPDVGKFDDRDFVVNAKTGRKEYTVCKFSRAKYTDLLLTMPLGSPTQLTQNMFGVGFAFKPVWTACPGAEEYPDEGSICSNQGRCMLSRQLQTNGRSRTLEVMDSMTGLVDKAAQGHSWCQCKAHYHGRACGVGCKGQVEGKACYGHGDCVCREINSQCSHLDGASILGKYPLPPFWDMNKCKKCNRDTPDSAVELRCRCKGQGPGALLPDSHELLRNHPDKVFYRAIATECLRNAWEKQITDSKGQLKMVDDTSMCLRHYAANFTDRLTGTCAQKLDQCGNNSYLSTDQECNPNFRCPRGHKDMDHARDMEDEEDLGEKGQPVCSGHGGCELSVMPMRSSVTQFSSTNARQTIMACSCQDPFYNGADNGWRCRAVKCLDAQCNKRCAVDPTKNTGDGTSVRNGLCGGSDHQARCEWHDHGGQRPKFRDQKICHCGYSGRTQSTVPKWLLNPPHFWKNGNSDFDQHRTKLLNKNVDGSIVPQKALGDKDTEGFIRSGLDKPCNIQCPTREANFGHGPHSRICSGHGWDSFTSCQGSEDQMHSGGCECQRVSQSHVGFDVKDQDNYPGLGCMCHKGAQHFVSGGWKQMSAGHGKGPHEAAAGKLKACFATQGGAVTVRKLCTGYVRMYQHTYYKGWAGTLMKGYYPTGHQMWTGSGHTIHEDAISSIKVPGGCRIRVHEHPIGQGGQTLVLGPGDYPNIRVAGMPNDRISAVEVWDDSSHDEKTCFENQSPVKDSNEKCTDGYVSGSTKCYYGKHNRYDKSKDAVQNTFDTCDRYDRKYEVQKYTKTHCTTSESSVPEYPDCHPCGTWAMDWHGRRRSTRHSCCTDGRRRRTRVIKSYKKVCDSSLTWTPKPVSFTPRQCVQSSCSTGTSAQCEACDICTPGQTWEKEKCVRV